VIQALDYCAKGAEEGLGECQVSAPPGPTTINAEWSHAAIGVNAGAQKSRFDVELRDHRVQAATIFRNRNQAASVGLVWRRTSPARETRFRESSVK